MNNIVELVKDVQSWGYSVYTIGDYTKHTGSAIRNGVRYLILIQKKPY